MDLNSKSMSGITSNIKLADTFEQYERDDSDISVVGSLANHASFWEDIGAPQYIRNIIENGYSIPLKYLPKAIYLKNNATSRNEPEFVRTAIDELVVKGAVMELEAPPRVVNPLTVAEKDCKKRLVLDLRHINRAVHENKCKIEGADTLSQFLGEANFLFGFDLKAGYHHVDMVPNQWQLLGFAYPDHTGKTRYFVFKVLPFGLSSAGFVFTKILRVLINLWRSKGIPIVAFFDDGIGAVTSFEKGVTCSRVVKLDLLASGFIPNVSKSIWIPQAVMDWLGFTYNLLVRMIFATQNKLDRLSELLKTASKLRYIHKRTLSSVTGSLVSLHRAYGDIVYLRSKRMQMLIAKDIRWDIYVRLDAAAKSEISFWLHYLQNNNGMSINTPIAAAAVSYSDASGTGCAAIITPCPNRKSLVTHREFSEQERPRSSTYRELVAVLHGLEQTKHLLQGKALRWHTDSKNICSIVRKGSMVPDLLEMALEIFHICKQFQITLSMSWLSRVYNDEADSFSRIIDHDDWGVTPSWFKYISRKLGDITIDRFADARNTKHSRFNSRFYCPTAEAIDAFTQDWAYDYNWLVPPLFLVARTIAYLELTKAKGIFIVPIWTSAHYWPHIMNLREHKRQHVIATLILGDIFLHYRNQRSLFGSKSWNSKTLVMKLDFSV